MRKALLFDGVDDTGEPYFAPGHPRLTDEDERARVVRFLDAGTLVRRASHLDVDRLDPARPAVVPTSVCTDGTWIWNRGLGYYVARYGIAPEAAFLAHMAACEYVAVPADEDALQAAHAALG